MFGPGSLTQNLTYAGGRQLVFLTLITIVVIFSTYTHADPVDPNEEIAKQHASEAVGYLRKQGMSSLSALPGDIKDTAKWLSNDWHKLQSDDEDNAPAVPGAAIASAPSDSGLKFSGLETSYHHKGFLPTHDAVMMGASLRQSIINDKMGVSVRPYYGQSWHSFRGYYGTEMAIDLAKHEDDELPWGKVVLGYVGGTNSMTDNGRGAQLRGDVNLTHGFQFTSGVEKDSENNTSPYMLLSWKMKLN